MSKYREMSALKKGGNRGVGTSKTYLGRQDVGNSVGSSQRHGLCSRVSDVCKPAAPDVVGLFPIIVDIDTCL
jgi:hypothetical protein